MWASINTTAALLGIDGGDISIIDKNISLINNIIVKTVDEWYDHLFQMGYGDFFATVEIGTLKSKQINHWMSLLRGNFDDVYLRNSNIISYKHQENRISQKLYVEAYGWFIVRLIEGINHSDAIEDVDRSPICLAILRLVFLDLSQAMAPSEYAFV